MRARNDLCPKSEDDHMAKSRYADATKAARRAAMSAHKVTAAAGNAAAPAQPSVSAATEPARDARRDELTPCGRQGRGSHGRRVRQGRDASHRHRRGHHPHASRDAGHGATGPRQEGRRACLRARGGHHGHQTHERHHSHVPSVAHYQEQVRHCAHRFGGDACRERAVGGRRRARTGRLAFTYWLRPA